MRNYFIFAALFLFSLSAFADTGLVINGDTVSFKAGSTGSINLLVGDTKYLAINENKYKLEPNIATAVSAAGTVQGDATLLAKPTNIITTVASSTGVRLPTCNVGTTITIFNRGANTLKIYPETGGTINGGSTNASVNLSVATGSEFTCTAALTWLGFAGAVPTATFTPTFTPTLTPTVTPTFTPTP